MDHAEAREVLELAAVEPGGIERLEAGDAPEAAVVAGHLLECASCATEWERLRATSIMLRRALGPVTPSRIPTAIADFGGNPTDLHDPTDIPAPADLRERTLRLVREVGRPRVAGTETYTAAAGSGPDVAAAAAAPASASNGAAPSPVGEMAPFAVPSAPVLLRSAAGSPDMAAAPVPIERAPSWQRRRPAGRTLGWIASLAAVLVLAVSMAGLAVSMDGQLHAAQRDNSAVTALLVAQAKLAAAPDARSVQLVDAAGTPRGSLLLSPARGDVVMVATDLPGAPAGQVYRCWMDTPSGHVVLGSVEFQAGVAYWWGWSKLVADVGPGTRFGVSLGSQSGSSSTSQPVLTGSLSS